MITVRLLGGMGNQMFQYACGLAQAKRLNTILQLDISLLGGKRKYVLDQWNIFEPIVSGVAPTVFEPGNMMYDQNLMNQIKDGDCLQGYWQSEKHFEGVEDLLRRAFIPKSYSSQPISYSILSETHAASVHVRRDDYLLPPHRDFHGLLGMEYYSLAMNYIREKVPNPKFFIFSEDFDWVKAYFQGSDIEIIEPGQEAEDIFLMSLCTHAIIANSSFSWWGSWLRKCDYGIVIAPREWFKDSQASYRDLVPERWIRI